jgi:hypothetical protein
MNKTRLVSIRTSSLFQNGQSEHRKFANRAQPLEFPFDALDDGVGLASLNALADAIFIRRAGSHKSGLGVSADCPVRPFTRPHASIALQGIWAGFMDSLPVKVVPGQWVRFCSWGGVGPPKPPEKAAAGLKACPTWVRFVIC